jgi:hypothetical protein
VIDFNIPVEFRLLENYPLSSAEIIFSFYFVKQSRLELLGTTSLSGNSLVKTLKPLFSASSSLPSSSPTIVNLDIFKKSNSGITMQSSDSSETPLSEGKLGKLSLYPTLWKTLPLMFKLIIRSGRNLPKADLFGKR